jgi:glyoxylase-like metal-dependent hydrolase (beta-lactamase superfamily II)
MTQEIKTITLSLPYRLGSVNCYLINTINGFILVDTGNSNKQAELEKELESAGCKPGDLKLIILTHGDFDHIGNAAYLRKKFGSKIAMHSNDSGMAEKGDMFWNRRKSNIIVKMVAPFFYGFGKSRRFTPDFYIGDGFSFSEYGFNAKVISIPGHSSGSIGIMTTGGNLICGDLFENTDKPKLNPIMDNLEMANRSIEILKNLKVDIIYPGHGKPFTMDAFLTRLSN